MKECIHCGIPATEVNTEAKSLHRTNIVPQTALLRSAASRLPTTRRSLRHEDYFHPPTPVPIHVSRLRFLFVCTSFPITSRCLINVGCSVCIELPLPRTTNMRSTSCDLRHVVKLWLLLSHTYPYPTYFPPTSQVRVFELTMV